MYAQIVSEKQARLNLSSVVNNYTRIQEDIRNNVFNFK
jgi:hypothetical protein